MGAWVDFVGASRARGINVFFFFLLGDGVNLKEDFDYVNGRSKRRKKFNPPEVGISTSLILFI